jgi:hypothetical protein
MGTVYFHMNWVEMNVDHVIPRVKVGAVQNGLAQREFLRVLGTHIQTYPTKIAPSYSWAP